ncbi:hypothetical protein [Rhodopseudomonas sp. BR0G17]|uniref:hypothetical protein n=1 Tax=Rhodopseudomonas sp. BR0G17 TaxID=2269368 RepID=UPI0013E00ED6|nr:hypothetical protein [Rhodopseudomonas sp. BR0G17]NEW96645.1 hypothetical protein [Rhodopseudomonas sp. BR0G17]
MTDPNEPALPAGHKRVPLKRPIKGHDGEVRALILREPRGDEVFTFGEPQTWVRAAGGMALVDNWEAIKAYADRLIVKPDPTLAQAQLSALDAIAVKEVIVGFFHSSPTDTSA